jgi:hypothetical protein
VFNTKDAYLRHRETEKKDREQAPEESIQEKRDTGIVKSGRKREKMVWGLLRGDSVL